MKNNQKIFNFIFIAVIHEKKILSCWLSLSSHGIYFCDFKNRIFYHPPTHSQSHSWFNSCFLLLSHELIISNIYFLSSITKELFFLLLLKSEKISMKYFLLVKWLKSQTKRDNWKFNFFLLLFNKLYLFPLSDMIFPYLCLNSNENKKEEEKVCKNLCVCWMSWGENKNFHIFHNYFNGNAKTTEETMVVDVAGRTTFSN